MSRFLPMVFLLQKLLLTLGYRFYRRRAKRGMPGRQISWVVGTNEIASMLHQVASAIPGSYSVCLSANPYYDYAYDSKTPNAQTRRAALKHLLRAPLLMAQLITQARGVIYVGPSGFLLDQFDRRRFEFKFLKRHGVRIVCYWTGSDIRSNLLMKQLERDTGTPNISTYISQVVPTFGSHRHEKIVQEIAAVGDSYADAMFSNSVDHLSYLKTATEPFLYFIPDEEFLGDTQKFDDLTKPVVTHASTSPVIKGTQLVRAAVAKLMRDGYEFEYRELIGVSHDDVLRELRTTHIALNHFYGFNPTVFGMEALAARCAVMMSSDRTLEPELPPGANEAWLVTKHFEVYEHLKNLLDHPENIEPLALAGQKWAFENGSRSQAGARLATVLDRVLDGSYVRRPASVGGNSNTASEQRH